MADPDRPILVLGPTGGGKSELAAALAFMLGGEIIGADSMQIYRHMDAGTAKPSPALRRRVAHHLIDCIEPTERFTVADWLGIARAEIIHMHKRGVRPIIVGGTNLYIKALTAGLFDGPPIDITFRASLAQTPSPELHERLQRIDPVAASHIHPNDTKRLTRALEVFHTTGTPISTLQTQWDDSPDTRQSTIGTRHFVAIGLRWPVDTINHRINVRVKDMFYPDKQAPQDRTTRWEPRSLPEEVEDLESRGMLGSQAQKALGYSQILAHLDGLWSLDEAFERTKIATRRFAKQQRTWLRRMRDVHWLQASERGKDQLAADGAEIIQAAEKVDLDQV